MPRRAPLAIPASHFAGSARAPRRVDITPSDIETMRAESRRRQKLADPTSARAQAEAMFTGGSKKSKKAQQDPHEYVAEASLKSIIGSLKAAENSASEDTLAGMIARKGLADQLDSVAARLATLAEDARWHAMFAEYEAAKEQKSVENSADQKAA